LLSEILLVNLERTRPSSATSHVSPITCLLSFLAKLGIVDPPFQFLFIPDFYAAISQRLW